MNEQALSLGPNHSIVGILTSPPRGVARKGIAVLLLNAGLIHHVGPNRLYVRLARVLASMGFSTVRFDFSGIGDSCIRVDNMPVIAIVVREP